MSKTVIPIFHGRVSPEGRFELAEQERGLRQAYFKSLAGQSLEIVVRKERTKRSLDQNAYIHAVPFPIFADYWGEDISTTKLLLLGEKFGWRDLGDGKRIPLKPSTSDLSTDEMSEFIEWMPVWGMTDFGLRIPLPNEAEAA